MTEHNAIEEVVAESYRTKIDAEELRREVKALLNEAIEMRRGLASSQWDDGMCYGLTEAYTTALKLIDEKECNR